MEKKYKKELNNAFNEFTRCLENADENDDEGFVGKVLFDLNNFLNWRKVFIK